MSKSRRIDMSGKTIASEGDVSKFQIRNKHFWPKWGGANFFAKKAPARNRNKSTYPETTMPLMRICQN
ncbi:hypothetical protein GCM10007987_38130 [Aliivibrio fischeri]|nr:hypothetical protein GCM10007987_38130 [Aliivibrio fischeri]